MTNRAIATCGACGGPVCVPDMWGGVVPPTPTCAQCGRVPVAPHGPVLPMREDAGSPIERRPGYPPGKYGPKITIHDKEHGMIMRRPRPPGWSSGKDTGKPETYEVWLSS